MNIEFEKWHGLGNDFIILKNTDATPELAKKLCDRNFGIGADGIFSVKKTDKADVAWNFYNSDGSIAQMCGNGIRCFAKYVYKEGLVNKKSFTVETLAGIISPEIQENGEVKVDMGEPILEGEKIPCKAENPQDFEVEGYKACAVSMGNPHCVIIVKENSKNLAKEEGYKIENSPLFPEKTNVEFIEIVNRNKMILNVWERGCGITLACGTGACASTVTGVIKGLLDNKVEVNLAGGKLTIEYVKGSHVYMTGPCEHVFTGILN